MKTISPLRSGILAFLAALLPDSSVADFSGGDSLAAASSNWAELPDKDNKDTFRFENSRLEFHNRSSVHRAVLRWTPNNGSCTRSWFVEVKVHLGSNSKQLGIGVLRGGDHDKGQLMLIDPESFRTCTYKWHDSQHSVSSLHNATLRLHFDHKDKTLTGSWKTRGAWSYFDPVEIEKWDMPATGKFDAVLIGTGERHIKDFDDDDDDDGNPHYPAAGGSNEWNAYFTDFRCGDAVPDIGVEQPAYNDLQDGMSKKSFGTVVAGGKGVARIFTIRNNGTAALGELAILKDGMHAADFKVSDLAKTSLKPGASTTFTVTFKPKAKGTREAAIHIRSNSPDKSPFDISLAGQGAGG